MNYPEFNDNTGGQPSQAAYATNRHNQMGFAEEVKFVEVETRSRTADRYLFFAGNLMTDEFRNAMDGFHLGGEYFGHDYPGLRHSLFALFRGRITPVYLQPRPASADEKIENREVEVFNASIEGAGEISSRLMHLKAFPGDQTEAIVYGTRNGRGKGIVELTALKGMPWSDPQTKELITEYQFRIFPDWAEILRGDAQLPETLRGVEQAISETQEKFSHDARFIAVTQDMLRSCQQFRLFGTELLEMEATRIRAGVQGKGYVHRYSPTADVLLRQLEMKRENLSTATTAGNLDGAKIVDALQQSSSLNLATIEMLVKGNQEVLREFVNTITAQRAAENVLATEEPSGKSDGETKPAKAPKNGKPEQAA